MQANQKSQFKKLVATGKISKRFPQDGWTQEMFDKDFACHSQRMLRIRGHVDASLPRTLADPPPWLNKSPNAVRSRTRRQKQKQAQAPPPWVVSESRNASNIPDQRNFGSAPGKARGRRRRAKAAAFGGGGAEGAAGRAGVDFAAGRIRARPQRQQQRPRARPSTAKPLSRVVGNNHASTDARAARAGRIDRIADAAGARPRTSDGRVRAAARGGHGNANASADDDAAIARVLPHPDAPLYAFDEDQRRTFSAFTAMLAQFDTYAMLDILEDALHDAQDKTLFEDYFGADETA